jgi:hypothetical protein
MFRSRSAGHSRNLMTDWGIEDSKFMIFYSYYILELMRGDAHAGIHLNCRINFVEDRVLPKNNSPPCETNAIIVPRLIPVRLG